MHLLYAAVALLVYVSIPHRAVVRQDFAAQPGRRVFVVLVRNSLRQANGAPPCHPCRRRDPHDSSWCAIAAHR